MSNAALEPLFVIDITRCTGCGACLLACRDRAGHQDASLDRLRLSGREEGAFPAPRIEYRVSHCYHCAAAPCVAACPTGALAYTADGYVALDPARCSGCGDCVPACPFGMITLDADGLADKCDGCADQVAAGWGAACTRACPLRALGDGPTLLERPGRLQDATLAAHPAQPRAVVLRRA
ncbi:MAG: 4Fe-4S dicluster domain-containing protein [Chloroflexi bacterium]|nr:4Fe-4S dicluster domain-containing protein [Chloroflexota bacterium]